MEELASLLETLYTRYNRREWAMRDPVGFLRRYEDPQEREVAGLVAAFLAYGRLAQIMRSVEDALGRLGPEPRRRLMASSQEDLSRLCCGFFHRTVGAEDFARLLWALRAVIRAHGSIEAAFAAHDASGQPDVVLALSGLAAELLALGAPAQFVADPRRGSACKRWNLFLRWMVRRDAVDPGGWRAISRRRLVVPLDANMWKVARGLGLLKRRSCDLKAALEVTEAFRALQPEDPLRYDFALMHACADGAPDLQARLKVQT